MSETNASPERWLAIPGYEGSYEVSDQGRVRSIDRQIVDRRGFPRLIKGRVLKSATRTRDGYQQVLLHSGGRGINSQVHKLALEAFIGPRPDGMVTRHLNGNPADNRLVNIAYGTQRENMQDRLAHGRNPESQKTHCPSGHPYSGPNLALRAGGRQRRCRECLSRYNRTIRRERRLKERASIEELSRPQNPVYIQIVQDFEARQHAGQVLSW